jgi:hypothetical protein
MRKTYTKEALCIGGNSSKLFIDEYLQKSIRWLLNRLGLTFFPLPKILCMLDLWSASSYTERTGTLAICSKVAARFASWNTSCAGSLEDCFCMEILAQLYKIWLWRNKVSSSVILVWGVPKNKIPDKQSTTTLNRGSCRFWCARSNAFRWSVSIGAAFFW